MAYASTEMGSCVHKGLQETSVERILHLGSALVLWAVIRKHHRLTGL